MSFTKTVAQKGLSGLIKAYIKAQLRQINIITKLIGKRSLGTYQGSLRLLRAHLRAFRLISSLEMLIGGPLSSLIGDHLGSLGLFGDHSGSSVLSGAHKDLPSLIKTHQGLYETYQAYRGPSVINRVHLCS